LIYNSLSRKLAYFLEFSVINFAIFIYFTIVLLKMNALDVVGLLISAFGLLSSLVANIVSVLESRR